MDNSYTINQVTPRTHSQMFRTQSANINLSQIRLQEATVNSVNPCPIRLPNNNYIINTNEDMLGNNLNILNTDAPRFSTQNQVHGNAINRDFHNTENLNYMPVNNPLMNPMADARYFTVGHTQTGGNIINSEQHTVENRHFPNTGHFNTSYTKFNRYFQRTPLTDRRDILNDNICLQQNAIFQQHLSINTHYHVPYLENFANNNYPGEQGQKRRQNCSLINNARRATQSNYSKYSIFNIKPSSSNEREASVPNQIAQPNRKTNGIGETSRDTRNRNGPMTVTMIPCQPRNDANKLRENGKNSEDDIFYLQNWYKVSSVMSCSEFDKERGDDYQQMMSRGNGLDSETQQRSGNRKRNQHQIEGTVANNQRLTVVQINSNNHQNQEDNKTFAKTATDVNRCPMMSDNAGKNMAEQRTITEDMNIQPNTVSLPELSANVNNDSIQNGENAQRKSVLTEESTLDNTETRQSPGIVTTVPSKGICIFAETKREEIEMKPQIIEKHNTISAVEITEKKCSDKFDKLNNDVMSCSLSQFYVIFHEKKLLCFGKGKYILMREFLHNFFDRDQQKRAYKLKMKLKIPFVSLPEQYRSGTLNYLNMKGIGSRNISYIGLIRIHQANRLYHIMSGSKNCNGYCIRLYHPKKEYAMPNTESECGGKACPKYSFPTTVRSPDEGYESVDASPHAGETPICDQIEEDTDACIKETVTQVPDMSTLPDNRLYKGGLLELFNKALRFIEIYEDKFLPLCDVTDIFNKTEVSTSIKKGNINVFRCTPLEAGYLNQFSDFKDLEPGDAIVHERLLRHICMRPDKYTKDTQDTAPIIGDTG